MSYMRNLEAELRAKLSGITHDAKEQDAFVQFVKALVLTSYRNGQKAGAPKRARSGRKQAPAPDTGGQNCIYNHDHSENDGKDCVWHE